jgi:hypothetical protein
MRLLLGIVCGLISFIQAQKPGADEETVPQAMSLRFHLAGSARFFADITAPSPSTLRLWARGDANTRP